MLEKISNRILGIIILFLFFIVGGLFYYYTFIYSVGNLTIESNIDNYNVEIKSKKLYISDRSKSCMDVECKIKNIPTGFYEIFFIKDGYKSINENVIISKSKDLSLDINFKKEVFVNKIPPSQPSPLQEEGVKKDDKKLSKVEVREKIREVRNKKESFLFYEIEDIGNLYFKDIGYEMEVFLGDRKIGNFVKIDKEEIKIHIIEDNNKFLFLNLKDKLFVLNLDSYEKKQSNLQIPVKYIKSGRLDNTFNIVTEKGTFIYNFLTNKTEYFTFFEDFIYINGKYIGIVSKNDEIRKSNLGLSNNKNNIILEYDFNSKKQRILYESSQKISKILYINNKIVITLVNGESYEIE